MSDSGLDMRDFHMVNADMKSYAEAHGWRQVRPEERELVLASLRRAMFDALHLRIEANELFALAGMAVAQYEGALRTGQAAAENVARSLGIDLEKGPKMIESRHLTGKDRDRHRFFSRG